MKEELELQNKVQRKSHLQKRIPYQKAIFTSMTSSAIIIDFLPPNIIKYFSGIDIEHRRLILMIRCKRIIGQ